MFDASLKLRSGFSATSLRRRPYGLARYCPSAFSGTACVAEAELRPRDVRHVVTVTPESLSVTADRARLTQVIVNLLDNAVKFTPEGGTVIVRAERAAAGVPSSNIGPSMRRRA